MNIYFKRGITLEKLFNANAMEATKCDHVGTESNQMITISGSLTHINYLSGRIFGLDLFWSI